MEAVQQSDAQSGRSVGESRPGLAGDWLTGGRFAVILGLLIFAAFPLVVLGLQTFVVRDFGFFAYPLAYYQRECFWRGELPLWNPYNNCGVPFLAQWNTMPLYPPALIYLLFPLGWSLSFFGLLHLLFAGLGMYYLALRWTGNRLAAAVAGLIFAFNGLSLNLLMWPSHVATFSWMPWVVLSVERAWRGGGTRIVLAAFAGALQMLAGGPETIFLTWIMLLALWAVQFIHGPQARSFPRNKTLLEPSWAKALGRFVLIVMLVAALAAIQLLPFLDLASHSQRQEGYADTRWSMPGRGWANFLVPMVFGHIANMGVFFQYDQGWTTSYYLGVGTVLLALLAVWTARDRRVWLLSIAGCAALLLAFGDQTFVYRWLRFFIPQLGLVTYPVKFVLVVAFCAPLLSSFGVAQFQRLRSSSELGIEKRLVVLGSGLLALVGTILFWAWRWPLPNDNFQVTLRNGLSRAAFLLAVVALLVMLQRAVLPRAQRILPLALVLLLWLDVFTHEPAQNPTVPPGIYAPGLVRTRLGLQPQPALGKSRAMVTPAAELKFTQFAISAPKDNLLVKRLGLFADCNLLDDLPKVNGFFSLYPRECGELTSVLYGSTNADFPRVADFMSVSQITQPGKFFEWAARETFLPIVTAGQRPVYLDDTNAVRTFIRPDFDGRSMVILPPEAKALVSVTNHTSPRIIPGRFTAKSVDVEIEATEPSLVVISQTYYHRWRAYIDGHQTVLFRANYAFQAVEAPAGKHQVRLIYEDGALHAGAIISGTALAGCFVIWLRARKRFPPPKPASGHPL